MQGSKPQASSIYSGRIPHIGRALRSRNFRLYIVGQGISLIDLACGGAVWFRADCVWAVALAVAVAGGDAGDRVRYGAGAGCEQHRHSDAGAGGETRPRDELLHRRLHRDATVWQPALGRPGSLDRRADYDAGAAVLLGGLAFWSQRVAMSIPIRERYEELGILQPATANTVR